MAGTDKGMSTLVCIFGEYADNFSIELDSSSSDACIWIRSNSEAIALTLTKAQRYGLRAALDEIEARESNNASDAVRASYDAALASASVALWGQE